MRPAQDGNFCLGVWEQGLKGEYALNHFPWYANEYPNNNGSGIGDPQGPTQIREFVKLSADGDHFTGQFTLISYDLSNKVLASFTGKLEGTRVTIHTEEKDLVQ